MILIFGQILFRKCSKVVSFMPLIFILESLKIISMSVLFKSLRLFNSIGFSSVIALETLSKARSYDSRNVGLFTLPAGC